MIGAAAHGHELVATTTVAVNAAETMGKNDHQAAKEATKSDPKHQNLLRSIINPENPFANMTDRDMLIFNPNYHQFLKKLKSKESNTSELDRIMKQPFDKNSF